MPDPTGLNHDIIVGFTIKDDSDDLPRGNVQHRTTQLLSDQQLPVLQNIITRKRIDADRRLAARLNGQNDITKCRSLIACRICRHYSDGIAAVGQCGFIRI